MTSQKRDSHRDSDKHWPFLLEVARTLYGNPGEGTPIHYLYGYVPPNGVVILELLI